MANYYALVSGLPNISVDQRKLPFTQRQFAATLEEQLTPGDLKWFNLLRFDAENRRLLTYLAQLDKENEEQTAQKEDLDDEAKTTATTAAQPEEEQLSLFTAFEESEIRRIVFAISRGKKPQLFDHIPSYIYTYLQERYQPVNEEEEERRGDNREESEFVEYKLSKEDRLSAIYYQFALGQSKSFVKRWFRLNLNLRNVLAVYTTRKLGWDAKNLIVGDSAVENQMRTSTAKDFGLTEEELPYLAQMLSIAEEQDISKRERDLDLFRWKWLDDECFDKVFGIERLLSYYIQIGIIERWVDLNEVTGEKTFRNIVYSLKAESRNSLEEFKKKQQK